MGDQASFLFRNLNLIAQVMPEPLAVGSTQDYSKLAATITLQGESNKPASRL